MVTPIDFGGHSSKLKATMGIIDKCGVRGDATLCVVIFHIDELPYHSVEFCSKEAVFHEHWKIPLKCKKYEMTYFLTTKYLKGGHFFLI